MNADRIITSAAERAARGVGFGAAIIGLQQTALDAQVALRPQLRISVSSVPDQCLIRTSGVAHSVSSLLR